MSQAASPSAEEPPASALAPATVWELRVLAGRTTGASATLERDRWTSIGHAFDNDVVLRDPGARGVRLRLRPREGSAELDLVSGEVDLLGQRLTGPATAILPAYVPLTLGEAALALGEAAGARWPEAERLLRAGRPDLASEPPAEGDEAARLPAWRVISPAVRQLPKLAPALPVVGGALVAMIVVALGWAGVSAWLNRAPTPERASELLAADGFKGLQVRSGADGLVIDGVLPRGPDLRRLQEDVQRRRWTAAIRVRTNDTLVQNVSDTLRTNGVDAEVHAIGPGLLVATTQISLDPARLETLRAKIVHETPGLRQLVINGASGGDVGLLVAGDPNKRVVSVVGGEDGFVKTSDGSRYFLGAVLPDGHTVTAIDGQTVTIQKDGRSTTLTF